MKRGTWVRWLVRAGAALFILLIAVVIAWFTGVPQEQTIAWAVKRNLGAIAVVEWEGARPDVRLKRLELYPSISAYGAGEPLLIAEDIAVTYQVLPKDGRRVRAVRIGKATVNLDAREAESPNYQFLIPDDVAGEPSSSSDTYLPVSVRVDSLSLASMSTAGRGAVGPVAVSAELTDGSTVSVSYRSARATASWHSTDDERVEIANVQVHGDARLERDRLTWSQKLDAPGLLYSVLSGTADLSAEDASMQVVVSEFSLAGNRLAAFLDAVDSPLRFDEFDVATGKAEITVSDPVRFSVAATAAIRAPKLAGAAEPLYGDEARFQIDASQEDELTGKVMFTFAQDQSVVAEMRGGQSVGTAKIDSGSWTRSQLLSALPKAFRSSVETLGFDSFTARADIEWTDDGFVAKANASSHGGGGASQPIHWILDAQGPRDRFAGIEGRLEARLGDRSINATASYVGEDEYRAEARIEEVQLAPWIQLFAGDTAAESVKGTIEGTILAGAKGKDAPLTITPDVHLRRFAYGDVDLDEITLAGSMQFDASTQRLTVDDLRADSVDGMTMFHLTNFVYQTDNATGEGDFAGGANLGVIGAAVGLTDLFGSSSLSGGRLRVEQSDIFASFDVSSDYIGWADVLLPYGTKLAGEVAVEYNLDRAEGALTHCVARVGDGTTLRLVDTQFVMEPLSVTGDFECDSNLQIAVGMGWLAEVEGLLEERSAFQLDDEGFFTNWNLLFEATHLVLPENAGTADGLAFAGSGTYRDGLSGSGTVHATRLTAAGGAITDASGPATFEGETMTIRPVEGRLFGGRVNAEVDVGVLVEDMPIVLTGSFDAVDLAILTDEVKPPNTSLTGTAIGTVNVRYSAKGLESFTLDASAPGGISVNRSLVSDLLQSDRFLAGAGERVAERAMDKLLGTQPQRPFDTGRMHVFLDSGKIQGTAELRSVKTDAYNGLNLTVNLDMDQSALAEALKVLEESNLGNVDF